MQAFELRRRVARRLRRHRRPIAAALAAGGLLLALTTLRPAPEVLVTADSTDSTLRSGEVAVPVALASAAIAGTLSEGDIVDVIGWSDPEQSRPAGVVAPRTRVLEVPQAGAGFGSGVSAVVLLAVMEADALGLTTASANGPVSILIRERSAAY